jgi:hypothetical protein
MTTRSERPAGERWGGAHRVAAARLGAALAALLAAVGAMGCSGGCGGGGRTDGGGSADGGAPDASAPDAAGTDSGLPPVTCTYFTATDGSDMAAGTVAAPFATIDRGLQALAPGDTLCLRGGTYDEGIDGNAPSGTGWGAAITVASYPGETAVLMPQTAMFVVRLRGDFHYVVLVGLVLDGTNVAEAGVYISADAAGTPDHIRVVGGEVRNAPTQGVIIEAEVGLPTPDANEFIGVAVHDNGTTDFHHGFYIQSNFNLVDGCDIYGNAGWGMQVFKEGGVNGVHAGGNVVRHNRVHDNAAAGSGRGVGIGLYVGDGNVVYDNVVWNNMMGMAVETGATNTLVYNNTLVGNGGDAGLRIGYPDPPGAAGTLVRNNVFWANPGGDILDFGTGTVAESNLLGGVDPLFLDEVAADYHLGPGSPALDTGIALAEVPDDADGTPRPQGAGWDMGAYEQ